MLSVSSISSWKMDAVKRPCATTLAILESKEPAKRFIVPVNDTPAGTNLSMLHSNIDQFCEPMDFYLPTAQRNTVVVGADGATHAGSFDLAYLGCLPGFVIMAAADEAELVHMVATAAAIDNRPSALRYPRGEGIGVPLPEHGEPLEIGRGRIVREGSSIAILSLGSIAALGSPDELRRQFDALALEDVFTAATGGKLEEGGSFRDVRASRRLSRSSSDSSMTTGRSLLASCMVLVRLAFRSRAVGCSMY